MLHCRGVHSFDEGVLCQSYHDSPHYWQSNGLAEKYIHIVKNLFYKAKEEGKDLFKCLMVYHNTPLSNNRMVWFDSNLDNA